MEEGWIRQSSSGVTLSLVIQPRASKTAWVGLHGEPPRLKVRVAAPPVEGEANEELVRFISKQMKIPKSQIEIVRGETGKNKDLLLRGKTVEEVMKVIECLSS